MAVAVTAKFRGRDGFEVEHACSFTADEWQRLERFLRYALELRETKLLSSAGHISFSLSADESGIKFEGTSLPDRDLFRSLLMLMRPFVLQDEETNFARVVNVLWRRLDQPVFRSYLDRQKAIFNGERCQGFKFVSDGTVVNSPETLTLWLNGHEYHRNEGKRLRFEALHDGVKPLMEHSEAMFVAIVLDRARAVIEIGNAIFALRANVVVSPLLGDTPL